MLQRYIYSQSPRKIARIRLANTLEMITCLREMADIKKMRKINVNVKGIQLQIMRARIILELF